MLRTLSKIAAAVGVLLLIGLGLLAFFLPRLVESEGFRTTLHARAAEALGSPVEWTGMEVALLPPRLVLESPMLVATGGDAEAARLTADSVDLRLATWPLLQRRIAVDSLVLRGLEVVVTRTPEGWQIPIDSGAPSGSELEPDAPSSVPSPMSSGTASPTPAETPSESSAPTPSAEAMEEGAGTSAFTLDLRRVLITESRIVVRDRLASGEPVDWRLEALRLEAKGRGEAEPIEVEATARLDSGADAVGRLSAEGTVSLGGVYDLDVGIEALLLEALAGYVPEAELAGRLSGRVSVEGVLSTLAETDLDLQVEDLVLQGWGLDLAGDLDLQATQALADPIAFVAALDLGSGGRSRIEGTMSLEGALDAEADVEALDLAPFASLAGGARELAGRATGRLALSMDAERGLTRLAASLDVGSARYVEDAVDVGGDLEIELELAGLDAEDPIRFDTAIDLATGGRLEAAGVATAAGAVDGRARFESVDLALLAPWLQAGTEVEGLLTGRVDLRMTADRKIDRLDTDLRLETARIVGARVDVAGAASLIMALGSEGPARIEGGLRLVDGGRLDLEGTATLAGLLDLEGEIERLDLGVATPFLPDPEMQVGGLATGRLKVVGAATSPEFVRLDVGVEDGILRIPDYAIDGPYLLDLEVKEPLSERPRGRVSLDLTAARVRYGEQLEKRAGLRAEMISRFVPDERGEIVFESRIKLRDIDEILLQGLVGESISVAVTTPIFDLGGWAEMLPALEAYAPSGSVAFEGLGVELVDGVPVGFGGRLQLRGVGLTVPDVGRLQLRGRILGEGRAIRSEGLKMKIEGLTLAVAGRVEDPLDQARYELEIDTLESADVNEILSALTQTRDTLFGALDLDGRIQGSARDEADFYRSLEGRFAFTIGKQSGGRLRGVSILRTVLDQIPLLGGAARLTQPFRGGRSVDDYFSEDFEIIEGDFTMGSGRVEARALRLAYEGYEARLSGPLELEDLSIDMTGEILLKGDLVSALAGLAGGAMADRKPIRIPLARVTKTLSDPKIEMTAETLAAVPKLLFQATGLDTLTIGVGKALGRALRGDREGD